MISFASPSPRYFGGSALAGRPSRNAGCRSTDPNFEDGAALPCTHEYLLLARIGAAPGRSAPHDAGRAEDPGRRTARLRAEERQRDRRPPGQQPGHGGTDRRAAPCVRHALRPHRLGRGPPDLPAQGADRPARAHGQPAPARWRQRLSAPRRERIRHLRHRPLVDLDLGRAGHGAGRQAQGRGAAHRGRHRRRRDERRHGLRGAEQRRRGACRRAGRHAGGAERQRHVDQPAGGRAEQAPGAADERQVLRQRARRRQERAEEHPAVRVRAPLRGAHQGHGRAGHDLRGVRLQLRRPDRRPRPRFADPDAGEPACQERPAVPAHRHAQGPGLQAGRGRPGEVPRGLGQVQSARKAFRRPRRASRASPRSSANGCATWPQPTSG